MRTDAQQFVSKLTLLTVNVHSQLGKRVAKKGQPPSFLLPALLFSLQGSGPPLFIVALSLDGQISYITISSLSMRIPIMHSVCPQWGSEPLCEFIIMIV